jgi:hypothetical protein
MIKTKEHFHKPAGNTHSDQLVEVRAGIASEDLRSVGANYEV